MKRVLLLIPTTSYRTQSFLKAAGELAVEVTVGSERSNVMADRNPEGLLTLRYDIPEEAARMVSEFSQSCPIDAVLGVVAGPDHFVFDHSVRFPGLFIRIEVIKLEIDPHLLPALESIINPWPDL